MPAKNPLLRLLALALALGTALPAARASLPQLFRDGFPKWDADHDGQLTQDEIDWGLASPEVKGHEAAALAAVFIGIQKTSQTNLVPPLSLEKLEDAAPRCEEYYKTALDLIEHTPRVLFANGLPNLKNFTQRNVGSCWALSALATQIQRNPADIAGRFTVRQNGFAFRFDDERIAVSAPTDGEIGVASTAGRDGLWSIVFEKAAGQRYIDKGKRSGPPLRAAVSADSGGMLSALTGHQTEKLRLDSLREDGARLDSLRKELREAAAKRRLMTAGRSMNETRVPGLLFDHVYAVLGYDPARDLVTLRDPHNQDFRPRGSESPENGYTMKDGVFRVPVPEFVRVMTAVTIEQSTRL